jgi:hypothetical protein
MKFQRALLAVAFGAGVVISGGMTTSATGRPSRTRRQPARPHLRRPGDRDLRRRLMEMGAVGGSAQMATLSSPPGTRCAPTAINLTYTQPRRNGPADCPGIASGDVPAHGHGPDLRSAVHLRRPARRRSPTSSVTTRWRQHPGGHRAVAAGPDQLYGAAVRRRLLLFWNGLCSKQAGLDPGAADRPAGDHDMAAAIHGRQRRLRLPTWRATAPGAASSPFPVDLASGGRSAGEAAGALVGDASRPCWSGADDAPGGPDRPAAQAENGPTFANVFSSGNRDHGTGNFNVFLAKAELGHRPRGHHAPRAETGDGLVQPATSSRCRRARRVEDAVEFMKFILSDQSGKRLHGAATCPPAATSKRLKGSDVATLRPAGRQTPYTPCSSR